MVYMLFTVNLKHNYVTKGGDRKYRCYKLKENITFGTIFLISFVFLVTQKTENNGGGCGKRTQVLHV